MVWSRKAAPAAITAAAVALTADPALAHHVMGGAMPATAWQGLLSGLGHPVIGLDHFAFIIGVGLMSWLAGHRMLLPLVFVAATVLGCFAHVKSVDVPLSELAIVVTLLVAACVVGLRWQIPSGLSALVFAAAGFFHGYAYGESIVGAEATPLVAYVIGFAAIQYAIAVAGAAALRAIVDRDYASELTAARVAGAAIAAVAAVSVVSLALAA
jgi:urease accessory protein